MLLEFKTENYKSFLEESSFSMIAAQKQKDLDYSLLVKKVGRKKVKGLCSSVIYGPNASGKTNMIGAMDVLRSIVLRGNINNAEDNVSPNYAANILGLIPNNSLENKRNVKFNISFMNETYKFDYALGLDLGRFIYDDDKRSVLEEVLKINDKLIFHRLDKIKLGESKDIKKYIKGSLKNNLEYMTYLANISLNETDLFLNNGFKMLFDQTIYDIFINWFKDKFMVIYRADTLQLIKRFDDPQKKTIYVEKTIDEAAKEFGINSNVLAYVKTGNDSEAKLCSIFNDNALPAEVFESFGTVRFVNIFPLVIRALAIGGTLIVDEFDASIHPIALMSIINIFHNDEININHAQLIFNTHNPIFLNYNLFRRDEIKFVEKDDKTHTSELYTLADFGTSGDNGVRKGEDYMKNYFVNKYGAIKDIDFSQIVEKLLK